VGQVAIEDTLALDIFFTAHRRWGERKVSNTCGLRPAPVVIQKPAIVIAGFYNI